MNDRVDILKLSIVDTLQARLVDHVVRLAETEHRLSGLPHDENGNLTAVLDNLGCAMINLKEAQQALSGWCAPAPSETYGKWRE